MTIARAAECVIQAKMDRDEAEVKYVRARDALYNALTNTRQDSYSHNGYTFYKRDYRDASGVSPHRLKELFMAAEDIPQDVKDRLIREAWKDAERPPGIAVYPPRG